MFEQNSSGIHAKTLLTSICPGSSTRGAVAPQQRCHALVQGAMGVGGTRTEAVEAVEALCRVVATR